MPSTWCKRMNYHFVSSDGQHFRGEADRVSIVSGLLVFVRDGEQAEEVTVIPACEISFGHFGDIGQELL